MIRTLMNFLIMLVTVLVAIACTLYITDEVKVRSNLAAASDTLEPSLEPATIHPRVSSITSVLVLDAAIVPEPLASVKASMTGTVGKLVKVGSTVKASQSVATITEAPEALGQEASADGSAPRVDVRDTGMKKPIISTLAGVVSEVKVMPDQVVNVGDEIMTINPGGFVATAEIEPTLLYRLYEPPFPIRVAIDRGPAPFDCVFLSIGSPIPAEDVLNTKPRITCQVPADMKVFSGIRAKMAVTTASAKEVLTVPVSAVAGQAQNGVVTVVGSNGSLQDREVELGITDGVRVEIRSGLALDEKILDLAPTMGSSGMNEPKGEPDADATAAPTPSPERS